jgi:hypothetical protein
LNGRVVRHRRYLSVAELHAGDYAMLEMAPKTQIAST